MSCLEEIGTNTLSEQSSSQSSSQDNQDNDFDSEEEEDGYNLQSYLSPLPEDIERLDNLRE